MRTISEEYCGNVSIKTAAMRSELTKIKPLDAYWSLHVPVCDIFRCVYQYPQQLATAHSLVCVSLCVYSDLLRLCPPPSSGYYWKDVALTLAF